MRYACFMKCFRGVGYVKLDLCEIFEEEYQAQAYCVQNDMYEYLEVDPEIVCLVILSE